MPVVGSTRCCLFSGETIYFGSFAGVQTGREVLDLLLDSGGSRWANATGG
jgi:hypothetical protein